MPGQSTTHATSNAVIQAQLAQQLRTELSTASGSGPVAERAVDASISLLKNKSETIHETFIEHAPLGVPKFQDIIINALTAPGYLRETRIMAGMRLANEMQKSDFAGRDTLASRLIEELRKATGNPSTKDACMEAIAYSLSRFAESFPARTEDLTFIEGVAALHKKEDTYKLAQNGFASASVVKKEKDKAA